MTKISGCNGSIYKQLLIKDTGCSIVIDSWANKIIIEGSPKATWEAMKEIKSVLHKKRNQKRTRLTKIIAWNGSIYKQLIKDTGCSIVIDSLAKKIIIESSPKATGEAIMEIKSILYKKWIKRELLNQDNWLALINSFDSIQDKHLQNESLTNQLSARDEF